MKTIIFLSALIINTAVFAQNKTLKAFYEGYDETYLFSDVNGEYTEFHGVSEEILKKYNLKGEELIGKAYLVTYTVSEQQDEEGFEFEFNKITSIKPIQLEKVEEEEDNF